MKTLSLDNIHSDYSSYQSLIGAFGCAQDIWADEISVELSTWFSANLSAPLGAMLDKLIEGLNTVRFDRLPENIRLILQKNGLLAHFGYPSVHDTNETTIQYLKLKPSDGRFFNQYVMKELLNRSELPSLSPDLRKKMAESIYEIFVNAQIHSETENIYTSGQFFPQRNTIEFTICDTGIGFRRSIERRFGVSLSAKKAIQWATTAGHTTKTDISGGIGLAILKEFVVQNRGALQIVSNDGFYELNAGGETLRGFSGEFPGTIVTMIIKTNDRFSYGIADGSLAEDLF